LLPTLIATDSRGWGCHMNYDRMHFSRMLEAERTAAAAEVRREAADRKALETKCLRNFSPLWRILEAIDSELRKRKIGSVEKSPEVPPPARTFTAKFSVTYRFKKSHEDFPIIFEFDKPEMLSIYLVDRSAKPSKFSISEIGAAKKALMTWASMYFRSSEAA